MAEIWPVSLPQTFSYGGFKESPPDNIGRSSITNGKENTRRRTTANPRPISGMMIMTGTQLRTFDEFFRYYLKYGCLTFNFDNPRTSTTYECRLSGVPSYKHSGADYWTVNLEMELLH